MFNQIELIVDYTLFVLSLLDGKLLHIPDKLTFYRIGSGTTQLVKKDIQKAKKIICVWNRWAKDHYFLYKFIKEKEVKKIAFQPFVKTSLSCYILEPYADCKVKFQISYRELAKHVLSWFSGNRTNLDPTILRLTIAFLLIPLIGKKRVARIAMRRMSDIK